LSDSFPLMPLYCNLDQLILSIATFGILSW